MDLIKLSQMKEEKVCKLLLLLLQSVKKKTALMPEPPSNRVFSQLQNLTKHNPACKYIIPEYYLNILSLYLLVFFIIVAFYFSDYFLFWLLLIFFLNFGFYFLNFLFFHSTVIM